MHKTFSNKPWSHGLCGWLFSQEFSGKIRKTNNVCEDKHVNHGRELLGFAKMPQFTWSLHLQWYLTLLVESSFSKVEPSILVSLSAWQFSSTQIAAIVKAIKMSDDHHSFECCILVWILPFSLISLIAFWFLGNAIDLKPHKASGRVKVHLHNGWIRFLF